MKTKRMAYLKCVYTTVRAFGNDPTGEFWRRLGVPVGAKVRSCPIGLKKRPPVLLRAAAVLALVLAGGGVAQAGECRVTGFVTSTELKGKTKAEPVARQFQLRVVDSPWSWQVGVEIPVTSMVAVELKEGLAAEVITDCSKAMKNGRLRGVVRVLEALKP